ncbi:MAG: M42 family metallopeptidase [Verrucomicrobiota bacterium]|jgi:endoglucanase|nr:M42 family metallopeptidase [Verrucomicrobiota bacterium]
MKKSSVDFLKRMMSAISPSGYELEAARVFRKEAEGFADEVRHDVHGNTDVVVHKGGSPRVLLAGHYDEIGFLITLIDSNGYLWISPIGGWDPQIPQGQRVSILTAKGVVPGVIGKMPIHVQRPDERSRVSPLTDLWVDIGAKNSKEAEKWVAVGDPMVLDQGVIELPNGRLAGRAFDDRAGAFVVLEAARRLSALKPKAEVHAVGTVQEEIGSRGAVTSTFGIAPDVGIAVDVTFATDHPMMEAAEKREGKVTLGGGPVLVRGANINPLLFDHLRKTAKREKIPVQVVADGRATPTDADPIQLSRSGVATALVEVPLRYMHTPGEVISLEDLENTANLLAATVAAIQPGQSWIPL